MSVMREFAAFFSGVEKPGKRFAGTRNGSASSSSSRLEDDDDARTNAWRFNRDDDDDDDDDDASMGDGVRDGVGDDAHSLENLERLFGARAHAWRFCKESYNHPTKRKRRRKNARSG